MDIEINVKALLSQSEPLTLEQAVSILQSWQLNPLGYYQLLVEPNMSVPLKMYDVYSPPANAHLFGETNKIILAPKVARKFFELENNDVVVILLATLKSLTFDLELENVEEDDEETSEMMLVGVEDIGVYAWPYFTADIVQHLSPEVIMWIILDERYVFNCEDDGLGTVYNTLYTKLFEHGECCDALAANSFNLHGWLQQDDVDVNTRARHYCFANYALNDGSSDCSPYEDVHFRKNLVHYFAGSWNSLGEIATHIAFEQARRCN